MNIIIKKRAVVKTARFYNISGYFYYFCITQNVEFNMFLETRECIFLRSKPGRTVTVILSLILTLLVSSCNAPIWSQLQKRADAERNAKTFSSNQTLLISDHFKEVNLNWTAEAEANYEMNYLKNESCLDIQTTAGLTLWNNMPFEGDIRITYEALVVDQGGALDRVSDLNCFWMASDPIYPDSIFTRSEFRKGASSRYYSLQLYSMCIGTNANTTTRFQRFDGDYDKFRNTLERPETLVEYKDEAFLIEPNHWYKIELLVQNGRIRYLLDGLTLVDFMDPKPLKKGFFGIRTTENHLQIRNFAAYKL